MKRPLSIIVATLLLAASAGAQQDVVAPKAAPASGVPTVTVAPVPVLSVSALSPSLAAPSLGAAPALSAPSIAAAPSLAIPAAAPALAAVPAAAISATPALTAAHPSAAPALAPLAAASQAPDARGQIERAAAPLAKPDVDAGEHLGQVFDSSAKATALDSDGVAAASDGRKGLRASGLRKAATPAVRTEYKSPEGAEAKELAKLAVSLQENGLPSYKTLKVTSAVDDRRPTVVILSPGSRHKVAIAREGGKQAPGDVHLALDASWLIQETGKDGKTKLFLKKGVTFDEKGQATIVEYAHPRAVHYFANYFTLGANDRDDGNVFEKNLDVPQSNSLQIEPIVNDKLRMSQLGAETASRSPPCSPSRCLSIRWPPPPTPRPRAA